MYPRNFIISLTEKWLWDYYTPTGNITTNIKKFCIRSSEREKKIQMSYVTLLGGKNVMKKLSAK